MSVSAPLAEPVTNGQGLIQHTQLVEGRAGIVKILPFVGNLCFLAQAAQVFLPALMKDWLLRARTYRALRG
jgi:hypothetical protein